MLIVRGFPRSVRPKSSLVRFATGPFLSRTMTLTWTKRADERKVGAWNAKPNAIATKAPFIYGGYHFALPATQHLGAAPPK